MEWKEYDSEWLARLAEEQVPEKHWLPSALRKCTQHSKRSEAYYYFVSPENANQPGAEWQFETSITLGDEKEGALVLDILNGNRVGGVEFLKRL